MWGDSVKEMQKIEEMLEASRDGVITSEQVTEAGIHRGILQNLVAKGELVRHHRGVYSKVVAEKDDYYLLQYKYSRGIYSHETALYLHGYTDRVPDSYCMTFPRGYNAASIKQENITAKFTIEANYSEGIIETSSPLGNKIRVYDLERTLCDIIRGKGSENQIVIPAIKRYISSQEKDMEKLLYYAQLLRVKSKILHYMEILQY